mmetsp:Transcript_1205/g.3062  ORF Transcript_1205/g.3062 Transcript_1205/m.3062 type:complete len:258 (-) Transcript_1205:364-1137(-)
MCHLHFRALLLPLDVGVEFRLRLARLAVRVRHVGQRLNGRKETDDRGDIIPIIPLLLLPAQRRLRNESLARCRRVAAVLLDDADRLLAADELPNAVRRQDDASVNGGHFFLSDLRLREHAKLRDRVVANRSRHCQPRPQAVREPPHARGAVRLRRLAHEAAVRLDPLPLLGVVRLLVLGEIDRFPILAWLFLAAHHSSRVANARRPYAVRTHHTDDGCRAGFIGWHVPLLAQPSVRLDYLLEQHVPRIRTQARWVRL